MSDLGERLSQLQRELPRILKDQQARLPFLLHIFIEANFNEGRKPGAFNATDKLHVGTGGLTRSFIPNQPGNVNKVENTGAVVALVYGSEVLYARIQEEGGFIRSKGKMHKYFWARFAETRDDGYKAMALSVLKNGGVRVKARPYFNPAVARFEKEGLPRLGEAIAQDIARVLNS